MKVLMVNGSPNPKGCTYTALCEVGKSLESCGVEYEIYQLGAKPVRDCIGCNQCQGKGCVFPDNNVNEFVAKADKADGFVFGSPVYFAHPSGQLLSFLDRVFYSCGVDHIYPPLSGKPAAAVVSARRGGTTAAINVINKYFELASMPIATSTYWNMVHGLTAKDVAQDLEGLQTMRNLGRNLAWMIRALRYHEAETEFPQQESDYNTNFIR